MESCLSYYARNNYSYFQPVVYKPAENAIVTSERNNDRKFMFLLEETKPDYRLVTLQLLLKVRSFPLNCKASTEPYLIDKNQWKIRGLI